jgi:hypothetical protein
MNWAQRSVSTRATVIYTGEPVWAGVFGRIAGERLPLLALVGAAFIVAGVLVSELKLKRRKAIAGLGAEQGQIANNAHAARFARRRFARGPTCPL